MSEELTGFPYHPDPLATGAVVASSTTCFCCERARILEDLDGGQLTEVAEGRQAVDHGGYGVGADPDQLRTGVVGLVGLAVELLDECLDVGGHDGE
ncbi:CbrC family protein [Streptomyces sp. NPDC013172]|uniref:CbrC family protein n=1 Tax=Streptomyces sp. NPDC013172 TaxID=3155009 RepID=UPI0033F81D83